MRYTRQTLLHVLTRYLHGDAQDGHVSDRSQLSRLNVGQTLPLRTGIHGVQQGSAGGKARVPQVALVHESRHVELVGRRVQRRAAHLCVTRWAQQHGRGREMNSMSLADAGADIVRAANPGDKCVVRIC